MQFSQEFNEFIKKHSTTNSEDSIIYSGYSSNKFDFPLIQHKSLFEQNIEPNYKQFFNMLKDEYLNNNKTYWFNERQYTAEIKHSGIVVDIDAYQIKDIRFINEYHCTTLVNKLAKIINQFADIPMEHKTTAFILMNPAPYKTDGGLYKEGIHILFPGIKVDKMLKLMIINEYAKKAQTLLINAGFVAKDNKLMVDDKSFEVPMQIYGTVREGKTVSHVLRYAYDIVFSSSIKYTMNMNYIYKRRTSAVPPYMPVNLLLELSIHYEGEMKKPIFAARSSVEVTIQESYNTIINKFDNDKDQILKSVDILRTSTFRAAETYGYVNCLNRERGASGHYREWAYVMRVILGIDVRYMPIAKLFSIDCDSDCWYNKNGIGALNEIMNQIIKERETCSCPTSESNKYFNILRKLARDDDPKKCSEIIKNTLYGKIKTMLDSRKVITQYEIAKITCDLVADRFRCIIIKKTGLSNHINSYWLEYITEERSSLPDSIKPFIYKWCRQDVFPLELHLIIAEQISDIFNNMRIYYIGLIEKETDKLRIKGLRCIEASLKHIVEMCGSAPTIENIQKLCQRRLNDESILSKLDSYDNVIGVGNGILVFNKGEVKLVQSHGQYFISQTTDIPYIPYDPNNKTIRKIEQMFEQIIPNEKHRRGMHMHFSQTFVKSSCERYFTILYSGGASGKSLWMKLFERMFGMRGSVGQCSNFGYYNTADANVFMVEKRDVNGVDHHLMKFNGARLVQLPEGKQSGIILAHIVKRMNDNPGTRGMYGDLQNSSYGGLIALLTNNEIQYNEYNYAVERRTLYFRMPITFKPGLKPDEETDTIKCMNKSYENKVKKTSWATAFLSIMVHYWIQLQTEYKDNSQLMYEETGLYESTINYLGNFNFLLKYASFMIEKAPGSSIKLLEFCERYVLWHKQHSGNRYELAIKTVKNEIKEYYNGKITQCKITGEDLILDIKFKDSI